MKTLLSYKVIHSEQNSKRFIITVKETNWFNKSKEKTFECFSEKRKSHLLPRMIHTGELLTTYSWGINDSVQYLVNTNVTEWNNQDNPAN